MKPSARCVSIIQQFEGCARAIRGRPGYFAAYPDPGSGGAPWTIGWGTTGPDVAPGTVWSQAECDARFSAHLAEFAEEVRDALAGAATTQGQFDALVSFAYNCGLGNLRSSTLLRLHKAGNHAGAAAQFAKWVRAAGRVLPGLVRRRAAEAELYRRV